MTKMEIKTPEWCPEMVRETGACTAKFPKITPVFHPVTVGTQLLGLLTAKHNIILDDESFLFTLDLL